MRLAGERGGVERHGGVPGRVQGGENLAAVTLTQPLGLVLGAEGKGLRQLTRETCSVMTRLDMPGDIKSLNVSNAAALSLYICASRLGLMPS